jgi:sugar lactone lactonase YvrE
LSRKRFFGVLMVLIALAAPGSLQVTPVGHVSAYADAGPAVAGRAADDGLAPRITVIVGPTPAFRCPTGIALDAAATTAWITEEAEGDGSLLRVDLASGAVGSVATGLNQPGHLVVRGALAFVAGNIGSPVSLVRINLNDGTVTPVSNDLGGGLSGVAVNSRLTQAHVVNFGSGMLSRVDIDPASPTFKQVVPVAGGLSGPRDIALDTAGRIAYVTEQNAGRLVKVDIDPASPGYGTVATIAAGLSGPRGLTLDTVSDLIYVAQEGAGKLSTVHPGTGAVTDVIDSLENPRDVELTLAPRRAWVTVHKSLVAVDIAPGSPTYGKPVNRIGDVSPLNGARGLELSQDETTAYVVSEWSGRFSRVDVDPGSPGFGTVQTLADGLFVLNDVDINRAETLAYVTRERRIWDPGHGDLPQGLNALVRVDLQTGAAITVTEELGQPTNIVLSQNETEGFVVDISEGRLWRVDLTSGSATPIVSGIANAYGVAVNEAETQAYLVTASEEPKGDILRIDLKTGQVHTVAAEAVYASQSIILGSDEKAAYVTEFGGAGACNGALSKADIDPASSAYGTVRRLVTGLCGPHDVRFDANGTSAYIVEVEGQRLIRVDFLHGVYFPLVITSH